MAYNQLCLFHGLTTRVLKQLKEIAILFAGVAFIYMEYTPGNMLQFEYSLLLYNHLCFFLVSWRESSISSWKPLPFLWVLFRAKEQRWSRYHSNRVIVSRRGIDKRYRPQRRMIQSFV